MQNQLAKSYTAFGHVVYYDNRNYFVVCTHVGRPCGSGNHADRTAKATIINQQVTAW